jgi:putative membrane protein
MTQLASLLQRRKSRSLFAAATAMVLAVLVAIPAAAQQSPPSPFYGPHMWEGVWWMMFGPLTMILFIAAIVAVVILLLGWVSGSGNVWRKTPPINRPLDILQERFARGEIDKQEFEERRRVLGA